MEKRTILAIALSFLVLMAFEYVNRKFLAPEESPQVNEEAPREMQIKTEPEVKAAAETEITQETSHTEPETDTQAAGPLQIVIKGDFYQATIDNKGAVLSSWILNEYQSSLHRDFEMIADGDKGEKWPRPGSVLFDDPSLTATANEALYEATVKGAPYYGIPLSAPVDVVLTLRRGDLAIRKIFSFNNDNYTVNLSATFEKDGRDLNGKLLLAQDIGPIEEHLEGRASGLKAAYFNGNKVERESPPGDEEGDVKVSGNIVWVGLDMHYFTAIAIPERSLPSFDIRGFEISSTDLQNNDIDRNLLSIKLPVDGTFEGLFYFGPKKQANLKSVPGHDLSGVIDYGMFSIIARPLLSALRWIHQYVNNYGFAIIILTLLLSILLFPLRLKQMLSMKKMQAVQPKVKAIQERYKKYKKTDPKRAEMNREVMALYKEHNVNPMSGCLPLLVQMPLLFAFYRLLSVSIELRQAPFIFWIQDLSVKDPYYVVPILMGVTMFLSQKMTPMAPTADSSQMKMMQYLPVIFTFMFLSLSSGLNLYFLCSNIFQVGFQKIAERWMGDGRKDRKPKRK